jgi:hypothetical protein
MAPYPRPHCSRCSPSFRWRPALRIAALLSLVLLLTAPSSAAGQSSEASAACHSSGASEVFERALEARGGRQRLSSMRGEWEFSTEGIRQPGEKVIDCMNRAQQALLGNGLGNTECCISDCHCCVILTGSYVLKATMPETMGISEYLLSDGKEIGESLMPGPSPATLSGFLMTVGGQLATPPNPCK